MLDDIRCAAARWSRWRVTRRQQAFTCGWLLRRRLQCESQCHLANSEPTFRSREEVWHFTSRVALGILRKRFLGACPDALAGTHSCSVGHAYADSCAGQHISLPRPASHRSETDCLSLTLSGWKTGMGPCVCTGQEKRWVHTFVHPVALRCSSPVAAHQMVGTSPRFSST